MAQRDRHLNTALPLVNCLKLVRGFAVWFIGPEVCVECMCGLCVVPYWCLQSISVAFALVSGHLAAMRVRSIQASGRFVIVRSRQSVPQRGLHSRSQIDQKSNKEVFRVKRFFITFFFD